MSLFVTLLAQRHEVGLIVIAGMASKLEMMNLQVSRGSAALTSPAVALQHLVTKALIFIR
jgi:hypothetical protein